MYTKYGCTDDEEFVDLERYRCRGRNARAWRSCDGLHSKSRMPALPPIPNPLHKTVLHLLHHHTTTLPRLKSLHAFALVSGLLLSSPSLLLSLLSHFPLLSPLPPPSSISYPLSLFHHLPSPPSTFSFNLLIRANTALSLSLPSLRLFIHLRRLSLPPDSHTFPFTLKASSLLPPSFLYLARSLHCQSLSFGFNSDIFTINTLMSTYTSLGSMDDASKLFILSPFRDVVSYNVIIDGYVKSGRIVDARRVFDDMPKRDAVSWGTMLAGYANAGGYREGIELFERMLAIGFCPDDVALVSVLSCCAQLGALDRGRTIHEYIRRNRARRPSVYLSTGLVDMYAKCGCVGSAVEVFEASSTKNLLTWNAIVVGVAMHGHGDLAMEYFDRMRREGVRPDGISFLGVLVGCSHAGMIDRAKRLFEEMERVYGVERELKHYGCMADLYARAGLIDEAMEMIEGMPMEADAYVWGGVLGGCRIHGNVEVAEIAMKRLLEIDGEDSGVYSIMMDVYSAATRWEDVERMRRLINEGKMKKSVAFSLIEPEVDGVESSPR